MKQKRISIVLIIGVVLISAYFYFAGKEYEIRLTEQQLLEKLNDRMPIKKKYFLIFEVLLDKPRVSLTNGRDRITAGLDMTLNITMQSEKLPLGGTLDVSGGLRYENEKGRFFLTDPVIENLSVQGIPPRFRAKIDQILIKALSEYYAEHPVYTLSALDIKQGAARLVLKKVVIESNQLVVTLGI